MSFSFFDKYIDAHHLHDVEHIFIFSPGRGRFLLLSISMQIEHMYIVERFKKAMEDAEWWIYDVRVGMRDTR